MDLVFSSQSNNTRYNKLQILTLHSICPVLGTGLTKHFIHRRAFQTICGERKIHFGENNSYIIIRRVTYFPSFGIFHCKKVQHCHCNIQLTMACCFSGPTNEIVSLESYVKTYSDKPMFAALDQERHHLQKFRKTNVAINSNSI